MIDNTYTERMSRVAVFGILGYIVSVNAADAQTVTIAAVTSSVTVTYNAGTSVTAASPSMQLADGTELLGEADDAGVTLECSNAATETLSGFFDAVVDTKDPKTGCTIDLKYGTAVATSGFDDNGPSANAAAQIKAPGSVSLVSVHTQFGISVSQQGESGTQRAFVLEGNALLEQPDEKKKTRSVPAGSSVDTETNATYQINADSYAEIARAYTALDVSQAKDNVDPKLPGQLRERWETALLHWRDALPRVELSETEAELGATHSYVFYYELNRATQLSLDKKDTKLIKRVHDLAAKFGTDPRIPAPPSSVSTGTIAR